MKDVLLTKDGLEKLKKELKRLIEVDRREIIKKIKETRQYGDLSENAEYDAARNEQSMIEGRIEELEAMLHKVKLIDEDKAKANHDKIMIGSTVEVSLDGESMEFTLVGPAEPDPANGRISVDSPLGQALIGAKVGQSVKVVIPEGDTVTYKVLKVN